MKKVSLSTQPLIPPFPLSVPLELRRTPRAHRISIRVDLARTCVVLVVPIRASEKRALDFLAANEKWLKQRLAQIPSVRPFAPGETVPVLGALHRIEGDATTLRGIVTRHEGTIVVPGAPEHLPRRLTEYLKAEARREIGARARIKAATLDRTIKALSLRDTRTRWGSCNASGRLGFSWRLIFAPEYVLDYVVAHEVAHLAELNHSPRFWKLCASLTEDAPSARAWLQQHGSELHRYG